MSSLQYLEVVFCFLSLTELTRFSTLSFVLWSFQVLGKDLIDYGTRSGKSLSLGMPKAPQGKNLRTTQKAYAWGCPGRHPLFRLLLSVTLLGAIFLFTTWYVFCLERLVWFDSLLFSCHNHPCCTHLLREPYMIWDLLEYSMCFAYIFWVI